MKLVGKTILLTGATGGIGRTLAMQLAQIGARLLLLGRDVERLQSLQQSLPGTGHESWDIELLGVDSLSLLHERVLEYTINNGPIDVVINNAGSNQFTHFAAQSSAEIEQALLLNLVRPMQLAQQALYWLASPGVIINIGSTLGAIGFPGYVSYGAAKAGLWRFSEALDRECSGTGIRVLYVAPRATDTALNSAAVVQMNHELGTKSDAVEQVAAQIIAALQHEKPVTWLGWPERLFVKVNQLLPRMVTRSLRKQLPVIRKYLSQSESLS